MCTLQVRADRTVPHTKNGGTILSLSTLSATRHAMMPGRLRRHLPVLTIHRLEQRLDEGLAGPRSRPYIE
jgi:hypothetical protein